MNRIIIAFVIIILQFSCKKQQHEIAIADVALKYKDLYVIDAHSHDAANYTYLSSSYLWEKYSVEKVVLFGDISEPSAVISDEIAWDAYMKFPASFIPYFSGFDVHSESCLKVITEKLERGFFGIGETVATSQNSPVASQLEWKGVHAMDGYFPKIYELCAQYKTPILLHIDPPAGFPMEKFEDALRTYPNTIFIFAHANAFNTPANVEELLSKYNNLYIDFFAGFTAYNAESRIKLSGWSDLITKYPDRFMVSTDSGFDIGYDKAYSAIYELFNLLDAETVQKIASTNLLQIIEAEPATETQINQIMDLHQKNSAQINNLEKLNRRHANEIIFQGID